MFCKQYGLCNVKETVELTQLSSDIFKILEISFHAETQN